MKQQAMRGYVEAWRRLPPTAWQQVIAFVAGDLVAALVLRLAGW